MKVMEKVCGVRESALEWITAFEDSINQHKVTQTLSNDDAGVNPHIWHRLAEHPKRARLFSQRKTFP